MTPTLAYDAYVAFHHLMGRAALDAAIPNHDLIKALCSGFDEKDAIRPATFAHFRLVSGQLGKLFHFQNLFDVNVIACFLHISNSLEHF